MPQIRLICHQVLQSRLIFVCVYVSDRLQPVPMTNVAVRKKLNRLKPSTPCTGQIRNVTLQQQQKVSVINHKSRPNSTLDGPISSQIWFESSRVQCIIPRAVFQYVIGSKGGGWIGDCVYEFIITQPHRANISLWSTRSNSQVCRGGPGQWWMVACKFQLLLDLSGWATPKALNCDIQCVLLSSEKVIQLFSAKDQDVPNSGQQFSFKATKDEVRNKNFTIRDFGSKSSMAATSQQFNQVREHS